MIGLSEILLIVILVIAFLQPDKLPDYIKTIKEAFNMAHSAKEEVSNAVKPYQEMVGVVTKDVDELKDGITLESDTTSDSMEVNDERISK